MTDANQKHELNRRKEARDRGLIRYFSGEPCKRGHLSERYVSNNACLVCRTTYYMPLPGARRRVGMTQRQNDALVFFTEYLDTNDHSPSYDEIAKGVGLKSKSGIHRLVKGLVERGVITYLPDRWRSIRVVNSS